MRHAKNEPYQSENVGNPVLQRLLQLYYFESTTWNKEEIGSDGLNEGSTASDFELYVNGDDAKAYLIWVADNLMGFVMLVLTQVIEK